MQQNFYTAETKSLQPLLHSHRTLPDDFSHMSQSPDGKVEESQITKESGKERPINYVTQAQD